MSVRHVVAAMLAIPSIVLPIVILVADGLQGWLSGGFYLVFAPAPITFAAVGWLLAIRRPSNVIGPLCLVFAFAFGAYFPIDLLVRLEAVSLPLAIAATLSSSSDALMFIVVAMIIVLFPDGRLPGPGWRWTVVVAVVGGSIGFVGYLLAPGPLPAFPDVVNPIGVEAFDGRTIGETGYVALLALLIAGVVALVVRWRRGGPVERTQIKWMAAASIAVAVTEVLNLATFDPTDPLGSPVIVVLASTGTALIPIAIGIAILRYRLYEIDRLVSRTIGWALVTGILATLFVGLVVGLQAVLPVGPGDTLVVAASTLVAFALFQPLRRRVQRAVDRRFDRARYDGERTAVAFAERLRNEVDLAGLETDLTDVVGLALRPSSTGVWIRNVRLQAPAETS